MHKGRMILPIFFSYIPDVTYSSVTLAPIGYPQSTPRKIVEKRAARLLFPAAILSTTREDMSIKGSKIGTTFLYQSIRP